MDNLWPEVSRLVSGPSWEGGPLRQGSQRQTRQKFLPRVKWGSGRGQDCRKCFNSLGDGSGALLSDGGDGRSPQCERLRGTRRMGRGRRRKSQRSAPFTGRVSALSAIPAAQATRNPKITGAPGRCGDTWEGPPLPRVTAGDALRGRPPPVTTMRATMPAPLAPSPDRGMVWEGLPAWDAARPGSPQLSVLLSPRTLTHRCLTPPNLSFSICKMGTTGDFPSQGV